MPAARGHRAVAVGAAVGAAGRVGAAAAAGVPRAVAAPRRARPRARPGGRPSVSDNARLTCKNTQATNSYATQYLTLLTVSTHLVLM